MPSGRLDPGNLVAIEIDSILYLGTSALFVSMVRPTIATLGAAGEQRSREKQRNGPF